MTWLKGAMPPIQELHENPVSVVGVCRGLSFQDSTLYSCTYHPLASFFSAFWIQPVSDIHSTCPDLKASWHCNTGT